jgi:membrane protein implicated in regulation of membrane protease activity
LQVPDTLAFAVVLWLLVTRHILSVAWAFGLFVLWAAKEFALHRAIRRSLRPSRLGAPALLGATAFVETPLAPFGLVRLKGERWRAELPTPGPTVPAGASVIVRHVQGLTLLVEPASATRADGPSSAAV